MTVKMYKYILLLTMVFLHIVDDFYLQGVLARMKQKDYWKENVPDKLYEKDYIAALIAHGYSWSFMVHIPVLIYSKHHGLALASCLLQALIHLYIDNCKANKKSINLIQDQSFHLLQILIIWVILILL